VGFPTVILLSVSLSSLAATHLTAVHSDKKNKFCHIYNLTTQQNRRHTYKKTDTLFLDNMGKPAPERLKRSGF